MMEIMGSINCFWKYSNQIYFPAFFFLQFISKVINAVAKIVFENDLKDWLY